MSSLRIVLLLLALACGASAEGWAQDSGGSLPSAQAAYDVTFYDLDVALDVEARSIAGSLGVTASVRRPMEHLVLNLDRRLAVEQVTVPGADGPVEVTVERRADSNEVWIDLPAVARPGETVQATVAYRGRPRVAPQPPWDGGVTWAVTPQGKPWVATSCQTAGADLWWPVKDHPSDEPDSMNIAITVPDGLTAASNGVLRSVDPGPDGQRTFRWHVSTPINPYTVALNVAPYTAIDSTYTSTSGMDVPVSVYALPSDADRARAALPGFLEQVRFLEDLLGPYPFRADKYGVAQTPFLGMEHQTIIAYGHSYQNGGLGYDAPFDALHFHELAHEWYGNCVTVRDWKDFWIHEGVATYLEALYAEALDGGNGYRATVRHFRRQVTNQTPIARVEPTSAQDMYGRDVYFKGAMVLHTLRYVIGDAALQEVLRSFVYPSEAMADVTGGAQCRHVTTADFVQRVEAVSGMQLDGFFSVYLYRATLPALETTQAGGTLTLRWADTGGAPFEVPVPVSVDGTIRRVTMTDGQATLKVPEDAAVQVDPERQILRQ